jgi:uncharacterized protein YjbI with pentapeptide repeats
MVEIRTTDGDLLLTVETLEGADLAGSNLQSALLDGLSFCRANLARATLRSASVASTDFSSSVLAGANLEGLMGARTSFEGADLSGANLYWAYLTSVSFVGANLAGACLTGGAFETANFNGANLYGANFGRDQLGGATRLRAFTMLGATYDDRTVLPVGFIPSTLGMVRAAAA